MKVESLEVVAKSFQINNTRQILLAAIYLTPYHHQSHFLAGT
jgi:hypothetical protein